MRCMLLGCSLEPRPNSHALGTVGSVMTIGLTINRCSHSKNQFNQREQDWLVQKLGLRLLQRFDVIQAESPFLLLDQGDKRRLWSQVVTRDLQIRGRGWLRVRDLTWSFFASSQNIDFPESFILPFFTRKVSVVIFSEGGLRALPIRKW